MKQANAWVLAASSFAELSTSTIDIGEVHYKVCLWPFANALLVLRGRLQSISQIEIVD